MLETVEHLLGVQGDALEEPPVHGYVTLFHGPTSSASATASRRPLLGCRLDARASLQFHHALFEMAHDADPAAGAGVICRGDLVGAFRIGLPVSHVHSMVYLVRIWPSADFGPNRICCITSVLSLGRRARRAKLRRRDSSGNRSKEITVGSAVVSLVSSDSSGHFFVLPPQYAGAAERLFSAAG